MIKHIYFIFLSLLTLIILMGCVRDPYQDQQKELAKKWGVKIIDYSDPVAFPEGYFFDKLKPGMSSKEVHNIIKDYEVVYSCDMYKEVYYYFSKEDDKALRFQIFYDDKLNFVKFQGEDWNSRYIIIRECDKDRLIKNQF